MTEALVRTQPYPDPNSHH